MKIVIVGPGALGCIFGGFLKRAGEEVALLDYRPERARQITQSGLWLQMAESGAKFGHVQVPTVERRRSIMPMVDKREGQVLRSKYSVKPIPLFTRNERELLAIQENDRAEEKLYLTRGNR